MNNPYEGTLGMHVGMAHDAARTRTDAMPVWAKLNQQARNYLLVVADIAVREPHLSPAQAFAEFDTRWEGPAYNKDTDLRQVNEGGYLHGEPVLQADFVNSVRTLEEIA